MDTPVKSPETKPSFEVRPIKNGFLVRKTWTDKEGRYQNEESYSETNPFEESTED